MTDIPGSIPAPPMTSLVIEAVITVITVGIGPNMRAVTLIRIERVSKIIPGESLNGIFIIAKQIKEIIKPLRIGCIRLYLEGNRYITS